MRRALVLFILLVACQNDSATDQRLKKVEKELADIKANPPVQQVAVPAAPPPAPPPAPTPAIHEEQALARNEVEALVQDQLAAYVPIVADPYAGAVLQARPGVVYLYRFLSGWYIPMAEVDEKVLLDGKITVSREQMERLHERLTAIVRDSVTTSEAIPNLLSADDASRLVCSSCGFVSLPTRSNEGFYSVFDRQIAFYRWTPEMHAYHLNLLMADYRTVGGPIPITEEKIAEMRAYLEKQ